MIYEMYSQTELILYFSMLLHLFLLLMMFRPQTAIIRCFVYAKTVTLYKMFAYLYTYKWDVSCLIYLMYTR
jgi:hypothetical protein